MKKNLNRIPQEFQDVITQKEHNKAQKYTIERNKLSIISSLLSGVIALTWLFGGGLSSLSSITASFSLGEIHQGVTFVLLFFFINSIINTPISIYSTFTIEEKFGFNKTTIKLYLLDLFKGSILSLLIATPILYSLFFLHSYLGDNWWLYAWVAITLFQLIMIWAYPKFISPLFNKFTPLMDHELTEKISSLCQRSEVTFKDYFVMDASRRSSHGNAYFTGFGKNKRIVFFDTLLNSLSANETIAVLAHELGHFKKKHITKSLIIGSITMLLGFYILASLVNSQYLFDAFIQNRSTECGFILFAIISPYYTYVLTPLSSWLSRKNEFEADEFAAKKSSAQDLINALLKMYRDNSSSLTPDNLYSKFYFSHPPARERISFLKKFL